MLKKDDLCVRVRGHGPMIVWTRSEAPWAKTLRGDAGRTKVRTANNAKNRLSKNRHHPCTYDG